MRCEEVREQLAEHLLGSLDDVRDAAVRRHLRGCTASRQELAMLSEGVGTFAAAAHHAEPPADLTDRVLGTLADEWSEGAAHESAHMRFGGRRALRIPLVAAAFLVVTGSIGAAAGMALHARGLQQRISKAEAEASNYERLLGTLGGRNVRLGKIEPATSAMVRGSVVIYDSNVGQSWVIALVQAPGLHGQAWLSLSQGGRTIRLRPMQFGQGGEASTFLVTSSDLRGFHDFTIADAHGAELASGTIT